MKSLTALLEEISADAEIWCDAELSRDRKTIRERLEHEGSGFATITLPTFSQALERGLETGWFDSKTLTSFHRKKGSSLPAFLHGLTSLVFESSTGRLRQDASEDAVFAIRQLCLVAKKYFAVCNERRAAKALESYLSVEDDIRGWRKQDQTFLAYASKVSRLVLSGLSLDKTFEVNPRHGPGAATDRLRGDQKYEFPVWHTRIQSWLPPDLYGVPNFKFWDHNIKLLSRREEPPVKVIFVPKTQKTPRVIAMESVVQQWAQQAIAAPLRKFLERDSPYTAGRINFVDQTVNQRLAYLGSVSGKYATIDMSEASDRVSLKHVHALFGSHPIYKMLLDCRSDRATLPDGRTIYLRKFASMGSACTFPVEAYAFFIVCVASRMRARDYRLTPRNIKKCCEDVYVYGDDIIVPANEASVVVRDLESLGFKVNSHKSFWNGPFRESCGSDWFKGTLVTPVYLRVNPDDEPSPGWIASLVATANQFYSRGYWRACNFLRKMMDRSFGPFPHVSSDSSVLGWESVQQQVTTHGWDRGLQRTYTLGVRIRPVESAATVSGVASLHASLHRLSRRREEVEPRGFRSSVPSARVKLKRTKAFL